MNLRLTNVRLALAAFSLEIDTHFERAITGVFGPSGAGKTSLLEVICGLRRPDGGSVCLDDTMLFDRQAAVHVPPRLRGIGYVPQDLALFPHLNVRANLVYGYGGRERESERFTLERVTDVMEIGPLLARGVTTLSGGEQQRVAFARALLSAPRLLLLDEPMSSLDSRLKSRLIPFLLRIRDEFHIPLIYVTHDTDELIALCDEILILEAGRFVERGSPAELLKIR